ncbi:hypothetical protein J2T12_005112 [Paenibacillus anaericanus]|uniref:DUF6711 family protein n=1 Tax=Paenibacillus anaericanus TaxID=170367 RepID=UPI00278ADF40|nr:DUF6711 family protein [Paenibacillus anaericanus]MDQ0091672.1 hypothetical protein [Paenibacillus anaericanus]
MDLKVNGQDIAAFPSGFTVIPMDLDDGDSSVRTSDGTLNRDRIAVKRQIEMSWPALPMNEISALLKSMDAVFFNFTYPDPMEGGYVTKKMYVGNRPAATALEKDGVIWWDGLKVTLTEG